MKANIDISQQHLIKGLKSYLELFIANLIVKNIPVKQQLIIDQCFEDIASNKIDAISFESIIYQLTVDLNEPMIVWRMVSNLRVNQLFTRGPLHVYLLSLPDIKTCLPEIIRLIGAFLETSYSLSAHQSNQNIIIEPKELIAGSPALFFKADTALCLTLYILKQLAGPEFDFDTIYIPNDRKSFNSDIAKLLTTANIVFHDGPMMASFPISQVNIKNKIFDKQYSDHLKHQVNELLITCNLNLSFTEKVRRFILSVEKPAMQTLERVADAFGMSQTTLRRKLKAEQQSFKEIQNEIIETISIKVLSTTTMKIEEFAQYIGYSDRYSFERFFSKKFGLTPAKYRKIQHSIN